MIDEATWDEFDNCDLKTVFKDGELVRETTLAKVREKLI
jgi:hypothetical protein